MEPYNRGERRICAEKEKGLSIVEGEKGGGERVDQRAVVERIYLTIKITIDSTSILCREEG